MINVNIPSNQFKLSHFRNSMLKTQLKHFSSKSANRIHSNLSPSNVSRKLIIRQISNLGIYITEILRPPGQK